MIQSNEMGGLAERYLEKKFIYFINYNIMTNSQKTQKSRYKKWRWILLIILFIIGLINSGGKDKQNNQTETAQVIINYPYEFIKTKSETIWNNDNKMDLYSYSWVLDISNLKKFSSQKKEEFKSWVFYFLVIFDNKESAVFPKDPFTASYWIEEVPQKHIRAIYTYNKKNGYSKLEYYDKNKRESPVKTEDVN